jgi:hypothetical protein
VAERPQEFTTFNHKPHGCILGAFFVGPSLPRFLANEATCPGTAERGLGPGIGVFQGFAPRAT